MFPQKMEGLPREKQPDSKPTNPHGNLVGVKKRRGAGGGKRKFFSVFFLGQKEKPPALHREGKKEVIKEKRGDL